MTSARTSAAPHAGRVFRPQPGYTASQAPVRRWKAPMFWKTGPRTRSFSSPRAVRPLAAPGRRARTHSRPRIPEAWIETLARAAHLAVTARHRQRKRGDRRASAPGGLRVRSRDHLLERLAAAPTGDHDPAVSHSPSHRPADLRLVREVAVAIPHRALERERQLVPAAPSLDIDASPDTTRLSVIAPVGPSASARPENGTAARVTPWRSSSSHTPRRAASSRRPGRNRAVCGADASRPDGVWHASPDHVLHVGQRRVRHPRATCRLAAGPQRSL